MSQILLRFLCGAPPIFKVWWKSETENIQRIRLKNKENCAVLGAALSVQINAIFTPMPNVAEISQLVLIINVLGI